MAIKSDLMEKITQYEQDGYSPEEIVAGLSQSKNYPDVTQRIQQYKTSGYSDEEIIGGMKQSGIVQTTPPPTMDVIADKTPEWAGKYPDLYGLLGATKGVARFGAETAALVGGGMAGAPAGPAGSVAGAGLLYGLVRTAERYMEGERPKKVSDIYKQGVKDVGEGVAIDVGGKAVGKVVGGLIGKMGAPSSKYMTPGAVYNLEKAKELGIDLTPSEVTGKKGLALFESMMDKTPFSADVLKDWRELRQLKPLILARNKMLSKGNVPPEDIFGQRIKEQVNTFLGRFKVGKEETLNEMREVVLSKLGSRDSYQVLGKTTQEILETRSKELNAAAESAYLKVADILPQGGEDVPLTLTQRKASEILAQYEKLPPSQRDGKVTALLNDYAGAGSEEISGYPVHIQEQIIKELGGGRDWKTAQIMRSELGNRIKQSDIAYKTNQKGTALLSSYEAGIYKRLVKSLSDDMKNYAESVGGEAWENFQLANSLYGEAKTLYNNPFIIKLLKENPDKVIDAAFARNSATEYDLLKQAVGDSNIGLIKRGFTKKILNVGQEPVFSPKALASRLNRYGDELLSKVYSKEELSTLRSLADEGRIKFEEKIPGAPLLKTLAAEHPSVMVDSILGSYERFPGAVPIMRRVQTLKSVLDKSEMEGLKLAMGDRLFKINQRTGWIQPEKLSKTIMTYDKVLREFYSEGEIKWLRKIAHSTNNMVSAEMLAANPSGTAQNIVTWGTWQLIIRNPIKGTLQAVAPKFMAKIYLSPTGRKYFTEGLVTPANTKKGVELYTKLLAIGGLNMIRDVEAPVNMEQ